MWMETIAFHSKILAQVPFAGYFILYRRLPKLLFSMKTLKWWIICLISYLGFFKIYFPILHVLCLFPWFFFISCVGCFTNIWEIEAKILIFQKIITTYRISVSKMIPAGFSGVHFFLFLIQNQTYCRLVGVLATNYRIRYSANKASYRTWTLSEVLLHMLITDAASDFSFINFGNFLLRLKLYFLLISWKSLGRIRQQVSEYVRLPSFWLSFGMLLGMLQSHVGQPTSCTCESAL